MKKSHMSYRQFIILTAIIALIDQIQKFYTVQYFASNPAFKVTSFFNMVMVWNYGVSFGMFQSPVYGKYIFALIAIIISYILIRMWRAERLKFMGIGIACIIGGAIGNVIDRFHYGAVADFFDFHIGSYHWPAFNIADVTIFIGAIMLLVDGFRNEKNN